MFKALKEKYGKNQLAKLLKRRTHQPVAVSFENIERLGIIYPADEEAQFRLVKKITESLPEKIKCSTLGFSESKELKEFHIQPETYRFFCLSDLNWYYKPNSDIVNAFMAVPFDVLIDFSVEEKLPVNFVLTGSNAGLITGRFNENPTYDFMINSVNENDNMYLFEQIVRYLKMLKTK